MKITGGAHRGFVGGAILSAAMLFALIPPNRLAAAAPLHFEYGNTVQLIDVRGELIEWPDQPGIYSLVNNQQILQGGFSEFRSVDRQDLTNPVAFATRAPWPVIRPTGVYAWIRASDELVQSDGGELFEIGSARRFFGRMQPFPVPPARIPSPPGVRMWTDFASTDRLRLAISNEGQLWAWESHTTNLPYVNLAPAVVNYGVVHDQFGDFLGDSFQATNGPEMFVVPSPVAGEFFVRVKTAPFSFIPSSGAADGDTRYKLPMLALLSNGELYQFGFSLRFLPELEPGGRLIGDRIDQPVKVERPQGVSAWQDFEVGIARIYGISTEGELYGWSNNELGQLGVGSTNQVPEMVRIDKPVGLQEWKRIELAGEYLYKTATFALGDNGRLYGWGDLSQYRLIVPGTSDVPMSSPYSMIKTTPTELDVQRENDPVVDFSVSRGFLIVLYESGKILTVGDWWGDIANVKTAGVHEDHLPPGARELVVDRPPFVRLIKPQSLGVWSEATNLVVAAEATDLESSVSSVTLVSNGVELGTMTRSMDAYLFSWNHIPRGNYQLIARATDDQGNVGDSVPVNLLVERDSPSLTEGAIASTGEFTFKVVGREWAPTRVEWSEDLKRWQTLQTVVPGTETQPAVISDPLAGPKRFYRVVVDEGSTGN